MTLFLVVAILFIALIKVLFGGDITLINSRNFGVAMLYIVPSSFIIAVGVVMYENSKDKNE